MDLELKLGDKNYFVTVNQTKGVYKLKIDENEFDFNPFDFSENCFKITLNGRTHMIHTASDGFRSYVHLDGIVIPLEQITEESVMTGGSDELVDGKQIVHAPMPGKIVKIPVKVGDPVTEKQILCVVEAMKMENEIRSKLNGKVTEVNHAEGDLVDTDAAIVVVEAAE
jgi:biotin carboxyl carrier protein